MFEATFNSFPNSSLTWQNETMRDVDVIIAARNEARDICDVIRAVQCQTYRGGAVRIVVADDGSTDGTAELARKAGALVVTCEGRGPAAARNAALQAGSSELVAFLDAHCMPDREWLEVMAAHFDAHGFVGGVFGALRFTIVNRHVEQHLRESDLLDVDGQLNASVYSRYSMYPWLPSGNALYLRKAIEMAGGFDEALRASEDVDVSWKVVLKGFELRAERRQLACHLTRDSYFAFLHKCCRWGAAAAILRTRYAHCGRFVGVFPWRSFPRSSLARQIACGCYLAGYYMQLGAKYLGVVNDETRPLRGDRILRAWIPWAVGHELRLSANAVCWQSGEHVTTIRRLDNHEMFELTGIAHTVFRCLLDGFDRRRTIEWLVQNYDVDVGRAADDVDCFISDCMGSGILDSEAGLSS